MGYLTHFAIDVDPEATPIAGYIATESDVRRPFHGWLELSSAIEERRAQEPERASTAEGSAARQPSTRESDPSQSSRATVHRDGPRSNGLPGSSVRDADRLGVAGWLGQRAGRRWVLIGAWTLGGWSTVAVPALAATTDARMLVWWALGVMAIAVLLILIWTEQGSGGDLDDSDHRFPGGPTTPSPHTGPTGVDRPHVNQDLSAHETGPSPGGVIATRGDRAAIATRGATSLASVDPDAVGEADSRPCEFGDKARCSTIKRGWKGRR